MSSTNSQKADNLLSLHHTGKLLVLPNIWDVLGVKLLEDMGFEAIATASASIAYSRGYNDGEEISFDELLSLLQKIAASTTLPVTADIETGFAKDTDQLKTNIRHLIRAGVVGINIEDSKNAEHDLQSTAGQAEKIKLIRRVATEEGIHLVINARTDVFISKNFEGDKTAEAVSRGKAYIEAGADCFYPILCSNEDIKAIRKELNAPINVLAVKGLLPMKELEELGIARLSLGPLLLRTALTKMREVMNFLKDHDLDRIFSSPLLTSDDISAIISNK